MSMSLEDMKNEITERIIAHRNSGMHLSYKEEVRDIVEEEVSRFTYAPCKPIDKKEKEKSSVEDVLDEIDKVSALYNLQFTKRTYTERDWRSVRDEEMVKRIASVKKQQDDCYDELAGRLIALEKGRDE